MFFSFVYYDKVKSSQYIHSNNQEFRFSAFTAQDKHMQELKEDTICACSGLTQEKLHKNRNRLIASRF